jgi:hypothetical protein
MKPGGPARADASFGIRAALKFDQRYRNLAPLACFALIRAGRPGSRWGNMAKADLKTKKTDASVEAFLNSIDDEQQREDSFEIVEVMRRLSGDEPKMWGAAIVGFGNRTLKYDSGRELDWMEIGFSPRKANLTLYVGAGSGKYNALLAKLGKYKTGKGCLYIKRLSDVDEGVLEELIASSLSHIREE